jgi:hypothetical protein
MIAVDAAKNGASGVSAYGGRASWATGIPEFPIGRVEAKLQFEDNWAELKRAA